MIVTIHIQKNLENFRQKIEDRTLRTLLVEDMDGCQLNYRKFSTVASADKIKACCELYLKLDEGIELSDDDPKSTDSEQLSVSGRSAWF